MHIEVIASSSKANTITVNDGYTTLLLDCGLSYNKLARSVKPSELAGVFISHSHRDHCLAVPELNRRGANLIMSKGTADEIEEAEDIQLFYEQVKSEDQLDVGSWRIVPFDIIHDVKEPLGLLFQSTMTGEKGMYLVDSGYVKYSFTGISTWLIECNYSEELLEEGPYEEYLKDRVRRNHFSLEDLKTFFRTSDMSQTEEIHLLHLSDSNSDEQQFKEEIQKLTGYPVYTISDSPALNSAVPASVPVGRT